MPAVALVWVVGAPFEEEAGGGEWRSLLAAAGLVQVFGGDGSAIEKWLEEHQQVQDLTVVGVIDPSYFVGLETTWLNKTRRMVEALQAHFAKASTTDEEQPPASLRYWWWLGPVRHAVRAEMEAEVVRLQVQTTPAHSPVIVESWLGTRSVYSDVPRRLMVGAVLGLLGKELSDAGRPIDLLLRWLRTPDGSGGQPLALSVEEKEGPARREARDEFRCLVRGLLALLEDPEQPDAEPLPSRALFERPLTLDTIASDQVLSTAVKAVWNARRPGMEAGKKDLTKAASKDCVGKLDPLTSQHLRDWRQVERRASLAWDAALRGWLRNNRERRTLGGLDKAFEDALDARPKNRSERLSAPPRRIDAETLRHWDEAQERVTAQQRIDARNLASALSTERENYRQPFKEGAIASGVLAVISLVAIVWLRHWQSDVIMGAVVACALVGGAIAWFFRRGRIAKLEAQLKAAQARWLSNLMEHTKKQLGDHAAATIAFAEDSLRQEIDRVDRQTLMHLHRRYHFWLRGVTLALGSYVDDTVRPVDPQGRLEEMWRRLAQAAWGEARVADDHVLPLVVRAEEANWLAEHTPPIAPLRGADVDLLALSSRPPQTPVVEWVMCDEARHADEVELPNSGDFNRAWVSGPDCQGRFLRCRLSLTADQAKGSEEAA